MTARRAAIACGLAAALGVAPALGPARSVAAPPPGEAAAASSPALERGLSDGRLLASADPALRAAGIATAQGVGARVARIPIGWSTVVRDEGFTRPDESRLPLSDPANATYAWERIDASVRDLAAAGLTPLAYLMAAPPWAQSAPRYVYSTPGTWAPRPADLAAFASAAARRYDGTYPDPLHPGAALPRIRSWQTWNEPNLARYLGPQWLANAGRPQLFSARWYRRMHAAAYAAIHAQQPDAIVGLAGLAPTGADVDGTGRVGPMRFLRSLLCLGEDRSVCGAPLPFDALALHPLSVGDPDRPAKSADDIALADLAPKVRQLLADARAAGRLRAGPAPALWITELNWTSAAGRGIAAADQAAVVGRAMLRLRQAGATLVDWQFATDPPTDRTAGEERPGGLTENLAGDPRQLPGAAKPFADGFAFPVAAFAIGRESTFVWGLAPTGSTATSGTVEVLRGGRWVVVAHPPVDSDGVIGGQLAIARGEQLRVRVGAATSPVIRSSLRLRLTHPVPTASAPTASGAVAGVQISSVATEAGALASRAAVADPDAPMGRDPRPTDWEGPGLVPELPPLLAGGTPPTLSGRPIPPVASPARPARRLRFAGTSGADVIIGSSGADRLVGHGGQDLLIGLGGDDRFDTPRGGHAIIVRNRRIERR